METLEIRAGNVNEAIEKGLEKLGKSREEVEVEVIDAGGFLKKAKVVLTVKGVESDGGKALEFISELLAKMKLNVKAELTEDEEKAEINISGEDSGSVIGYRGDVLDALQYITSVVVNKGQENYKKILLDCGNYRGKRTETLISLAEKLAAKAVEKGRKLTLEPMNPFERRIIHFALQSNENVTTESEGVDPNRHIVIVPKNLRPYEGGYNRGSREGGYNRSGGSREGGFNRDRQGSYNNREGAPREGGYGNRSGGSREGGYNRDRQGSYNNREGAPREGGYSRDSAPREGGYGNRSGASREGGYNRDRGDRQKSGGTGANNSGSFNSFGTYLGNSKSGFSPETDFTKKSGFDNLKD